MGKQDIELFIITFQGIKILDGNLLKTDNRFMGDFYRLFLYSLLKIFKFLSKIVLLLKENNNKSGLANLKKHILLLSILMTVSHY